MSLETSDEFRREAVQLALTSGLSRKQVAADLGLGMSTLNKWVAQHKHDDLMSGPHDDLHKELARLRKENRILKEEREILKKADHPIHLLCKAFNISPSGYYDWCKRPMSQRQPDDLALRTNIRTIHKENYQSYGRERIASMMDLLFGKKSVQEANSEIRSTKK
ncbi:transposase [Terasakiella sp.]|uniref:transposase n=1 Tax=Terasakiella sp. TaxID=2034861 RepID=UPI003AA983C8